MSADTVGPICFAAVGIVFMIGITLLFMGRPRGHQPRMKRVIDPIPPSGFGGAIPDDPIKLDPRLSSRPSGFGSCVPNPWATTNEETIRRIVREELAKREGVE